MERRGWRPTGERWRRGAFAVAVALTLGLGQANAFVENAHEGGQGQDKERTGGRVDLRSPGKASSRETTEAELAAERQELEASAGTTEAPDATVDAGAAIVRQAGIAEPQTRTVTRTRASQGIIKSVTRSVTYTEDEDGKTVLARAVARARVPDDVAAVENGAGRIVAKTSTDVPGPGLANANAGGTIGISGGEVEVSTFGKTSAEVH